MFRQFKFEEPLYQNLEQIPVSTQFKLEAMGLQIPLDLWNHLPLEERWVLCHLAIRSKGERECYSQYLDYVFRRLGKKTAPIKPAGASHDKKSWEDLARLPSEVAQKMRDLNLSLFWPEWIKLDDIERYVLYKLCRENSSDSQIQQVVHEFLGSSNSSMVPAP